MDQTVAINILQQTQFMDTCRAHNITTGVLEELALLRTQIANATNAAHVHAPLQNSSLH